MNKPKIGAREAVKDITSGMTDADLMKKYNLSAKGLASLFRKLAEAKLLEVSFVRTRTPPTAAAEIAKSMQSPVPAPAPTNHGSGKPAESDRAVLQDIKAGLHDAEIMRRHELSPGNLKQITASLVQAGLLDAAGMGRPADSKARLCPFCSRELKASAGKCVHCGRWLEPASPTDPTEAASSGSIFDRCSFR